MDKNVELLAVLAAIVFPAVAKGMKQDNDELHSDFRERVVEESICVASVIVMKVTEANKGKGA